MAQIDLTKEEEKSVALKEYPFLKDVCSHREISVIHFASACEIIVFGQSCGNGMNCTGQAHRIKDGKILSSITWDKIREKQKEAGLPDSHKIRAETILTGDEDAFVFVQTHKTESGDKAWISLNVYMCSGCRTFSDYPQIMEWIKGDQIRKAIKEVIER